MKEHSMSGRHERLKTIFRLLKENQVESQEELLVLLESNGVFITQATLSRDLKVLKASKMGTGAGGYFYVVPSDDELQRREEIYAQDFIRGYVSIDWNDNFAVVRTFSGHSAPVALAIDNLRLDGVLGTVAGQDNTVFVALRRGYSGEELIRDLKARIHDFEES